MTSIIDDYIENREEALKGIIEWNRTASDHINELVKEAEKGIGESPEDNVDSYVLINPKNANEDIDTGSKQHAYLIYAIAAWIELEPAELKNELEGRLEEDPLGKFISYINSNYSDLSLDAMTAAFYDPARDAITFLNIPDRMQAIEVNDNATQAARTLENFLKRSGKTGEEVKATIRHEMTHAYISNYQEETLGDMNLTAKIISDKNFKFERMAIDEAAAHVISGLTTDEEIAVEGYRSKNIPMEDYHFLEHVLHSFAQDMMSEGKGVSETIFEVRKEGCMMVKKLYKLSRSEGDYSITEVAFQDDVQIFKDLYEVLKLFENFEDKLGGVVDLLDLRSGESFKMSYEHPSELIEDNKLLNLIYFQDTESIKTADLFRSEVVAYIGENSLEFAEKTEKEVLGTQKEETPNVNIHSVVNKFSQARKELVSLKEEIEDLEKKSGQSKRLEKEKKEIEKMIKEISQLLKNYQRRDKLDKYMEKAISQEGLEISVSRAKSLIEDENRFSANKIEREKEDLQQYLEEVREAHLAWTTALELFLEPFEEFCKKLHGELEAEEEKVKETSMNVGEMMNTNPSLKEEEKTKYSYSKKGKGNREQVINKLKLEFEEEYEDIEALIELTEDLYEFIDFSLKKSEEAKKEMKLAKKEIAQIEDERNSSESILSRLGEILSFK